MSATTFSEQIGIRRVSESSPASSAGCEYFESTHHPAWMGNSMPIAYGGCTLAIGIHAACLSVWSHPQSPSSAFKPYTVLGHFLGPALVDRRLKCEVSRVRDSRTFKTRRVTVSQKYDDGSVRECLSLTADFMRVEQAAEMEYSAPPVGRQQNGKPLLEGPPSLQHFDSSVSGIELGVELVAQGHVPETEAQKYLSTFGMEDKFFESRYCRNSVGGQNLVGLAKHLRTTQDEAGYSVTDKTTSEWSRTRSPLATEAENVAALGFNMDGGLSITPLMHGGQGKWLDDVGACSSLDFALRLFYSGAEMIDVSKWRLREVRTIAAAGGRTYSESRVWNESGKMIATMTQVNILRPKEHRSAKADKL